MCFCANQHSMATIKYIDLFCGLGAFHTAFAEAGDLECVLACDIDEGARAIYEANYGIAPRGDIRELVDIPDFDILCAGFPCQPFSIAGNGEGFADTTKGNLFYEILRIIDTKQPPMCILENVKNLETHDGGRTFGTIKTELEGRGYRVVSRVINAATCGSPQSRQRIFIIASKSEFEFPPIVILPRPVSSILESGSTPMDLSKYILVDKNGKRPSVEKPHIVQDVVSRTTGKGGRQGERVYSVHNAGVTVCASSGGPGAKTGLYRVDNGVRRLSVRETLRMFGFPDTYTFAGIPTEKCLFYLGNSIVVDVIRSLVPAVKAYFQAGEAV
jgi:DNA (cytosine-5)-methyltransferase 1